jgi:hypothetical protein
MYIRKGTPKPILAKYTKRLSALFFGLPTAKLRFFPLTTTEQPDPIREPKDFRKMTLTIVHFSVPMLIKATKVYNLLITSISINELKKHLLLNLQGHNLWVTNDSLKAREMSVIAFHWKAPAHILHRPTFAKKINGYLSKI